MPFGIYAIVGDGAERIGVEEFRSAPGPAGWRYFSEVETRAPTPHRETIDLAVDADRRIAQVRIATGEHEIFLRPSPDRTALAGVRDGTAIEIPYGPTFHLDYFTPATNAITARRLAETTEIDVVYLEPVTLEPSRVRQRYEALGPERVRTPVGSFDADRWRFTSLDSGWSSDVWVAGDIVVRYDGLFELARLDPGASGPWPVGRTS